MMMLDAETRIDETETETPDAGADLHAETVVEVHDVSKKFARSLRRSLFYAARDLGRELTGKDASTDLRKDEFWALRDIAFTLKKGEAIGIIGPNGAGKSTLLKIINGIIKPSRGFVRTRGRVQALIELSAGMNPILTGRENIYIRAMLLGLSRATIDERLDDIVAFAELEDFIDMPVQNYSSGMRVKLGFSIAINVDPDILILDEVLAVGDQRFRAKARDAMMKLLNRKAALIFISHNMDQVINITDKVLWIDKGQERAIGPCRDICTSYLIDQQRPRVSQGLDAGLPKPMPRSSGHLSLDRVDIAHENRDEDQRLVIGGDLSMRHLTVTLTLSFREEIGDKQIYFTLFVSQSDTTMTAYKMIQDNVDVELGGSFERTFTLDLSMYHPGIYQLGLYVHPENNASSLLYGTRVILEFVVQAPVSLDRPWISGQQHDSRMIYNSLGAVVLPVEMRPVRSNRAPDAA